MSNGKPLEGLMVVVSILYFLSGRASQKQIEEMGYTPR